MAMLLAVVAAPGVAQSAAATDEHACDPAFEHDTYGSVKYCPIWLPTRGYVPVHALGSGRPVEVGRLNAAGKANWFICQMNDEAIDYTAPGTGYRNTWWALTRPEGNEPGRSPSSGRQRWSWWGGGVERARFKGTTATRCCAYFGVEDWGDRLEPQVRGKCSVKGRGSVDLLIAAVPGRLEDRQADGLPRTPDGKMAGGRICFDAVLQKDGSYTGMRTLTICGSIPSRPPQRIRPGRQP